MKRLLEQLSDFDLFLVLWYVRYKHARHILRQTFPHWFRPPRLLFIACYAFILYTVMATIILIASQHLQAGVILFGLFVVPLYAVVLYSRFVASIRHQRVMR